MFLVSFEKYGTLSIFSYQYRHLGLAVQLITSKMVKRLTIIKKIGFASDLQSGFGLVLNFFCD